MLVENLIIHDREGADNWINGVAGYMSIHGWREMLIYDDDEKCLACLIDMIYPIRLQEYVDLATKSYEEGEFPIIIGERGTLTLMCLDLNEVRKRFQEIVN